MNKGVHISFQISVFVFFRKILRSGLARSKTLAPWKKSCAKPRQTIKKKRHYFTNKGPDVQSYDFSSSHVWMWDLDHEKGWTLKNWCFQIVVLEKTLESPLDHKEIKAVYRTEINPEYSLKGLMLKLKLQSFGHLMQRADSLGKKPWCWERLKARGEGGNGEWDGWLDRITDSMDVNLSKL